MAVGLVRIFYNPLAPSQKFQRAVPILNFFGMVVRQPRKSFESSHSMVKHLQGCLLYRSSCIWAFFDRWAFCSPSITFVWQHHHIYLLIPLLLIPNLHHDLNSLFFTLYSLIPSEIYTQLIYVSFPKNHLVFTIPFSGMILSTFMLILHYSHVFTLHNYRVNQKDLKRVHDNIFGSIYRC